MLILVTLLENKDKKAEYKFGVDRNSMNGVFILDLEDINASKVVKNNPDIPSHWIYKAMAKGLSKALEAGAFPSDYHYMV